MMIFVSRTAIWGLRLLVLLPITAACTPHEDPCLGISQSRSCLYESGSGGGLLFNVQVSQRSVFTPHLPIPQPTEPTPAEPMDHDDHYTGPDLDRDYDDHKDDEHKEDHDDNDSSEEAHHDDSKQKHHDVSRRRSS